MIYIRFLMRLKSYALMLNIIIAFLPASPVWDTNFNSVGIECFLDSF